MENSDKLIADTGSIEVGKSADFVILSHNLFEIPPEKISETDVLLTVFEGEVVFDASKENPHNEKFYLDIGKREMIYDYPPRY